MRIYDVPEPVVAYRTWKVKVDHVKGPVLGSLSFESTWDTKDFEATACGAQQAANSQLQALKAFLDVMGPPKCNGPVCDGKQVGKLAEGCGIYALKDLPLCLEGLGWGGVIGRVLLHGKYWPHATGYRAHRARIDGLYDPRAFSEWFRYFEHSTYPVLFEHVELLAHKYEVPLLRPTPQESDAITEWAERLWVGTRL